MIVPPRPRVTRRLEDTSQTTDLRPIIKAAIAAKPTMPVEAISSHHFAADEWVRDQCEHKPKPYLEISSSGNTFYLAYELATRYALMYGRYPNEIVLGEIVRRLVDMPEDRYYIPGTNHLVTVSYELGPFAVLVR